MVVSHMQTNASITQDIQQCRKYHNIQENSKTKPGKEEQNRTFIDNQFIGGLEGGSSGKTLEGPDPSPGIAD